MNFVAIKNKGIFETKKILQVCWFAYLQEFPLKLWHIEGSWLVVPNALSQSLYVDTTQDNEVQILLPPHVWAVHVEVASLDISSDQNTDLFILFKRKEVPPLCPDGLIFLNDILYFHHYVRVNGICSLPLSHTCGWDSNSN